MPLENLPHPGQVSLSTPNRRVKHVELVEPPVPIRASEIRDPFGNRISLYQRVEEQKAPTGNMFDLAEPLTPVLRTFDMAKLKEFYLEFLEMKEDWRHQFREDGPIYMQVSDGEFRLHLSEHNGDCTPGSNTNIYVRDLEALIKRLLDKKYRYLRPGVGNDIPGLKNSALLDPFGNRLGLLERIATS